MLELYSLISGSSGNCTLITDGRTNLLLDCGTSGKRAFLALAALGVTPDMIDALLVTHEHSDHTKGIGVIARKLKIPVYATAGTHLNMDIGEIKDEQRIAVTPDSQFEIGSIAVCPFSIPHDAADPCGYCFENNETRVGVATDIGHMSDELLSKISGCKSIILESNHDVDMLRYGEYPYPLKQRILSDIGHLSNEMASYAALELVKSGTEHIMLGHLSDKNNLPEIAMMETFNRLSDNGVDVGKDVTLQVANRFEITRFNQ